MQGCYTPLNSSPCRRLIVSLWSMFCCPSAPYLKSCANLCRTLWTIPKYSAVSCNHILDISCFPPTFPPSLPPPHCLIHPPFLDPPSFPWINYFPYAFSCLIFPPGLLHLFLSTFSPKASPHASPCAFYLPCLFPTYFLSYLISLGLFQHALLSFSTSPPLHTLPLPLSPLSVLPPLHLPTLLALFPRNLFLLLLFPTHLF